MTITKRELKSTDLVAVRMVEETIARMFGLRIKPIAMNVKLVIHNPADQPRLDWLENMQHSLPEVDYLNAMIGIKRKTWNKFVIDIQAAIEYAGGQASLKFECVIFKLGSMIYPFEIILRPYTGEGALSSIKYEWVRFSNEPIQAGIANPAHFRDRLLL